MEKYGFSNILENSMENLLLAEKQIKDQKNGTSSQCYMKLEDFWKKIDAISEKLSFECTKLCICLCNPPLPSSSEISSLLLAIEQTVFTLASTSCQFDPVYGKVLHNKLIQASINAIQSARQLLRIIKDEGGAEVNERYRHATGITWEGCKSLGQCPHNNKNAVLLILEEQHSLIADAYMEINQSLEENSNFGCFTSSFNSDTENEDEEEAVWSDEDKLTINPSINLLKAGKMMFDRLITAVRRNGSYDEPNKVSELDQLGEDCSPISARVDALVLDLYPPLDVADMGLQSQTLAAHLQTVLKTAVSSHVITENEATVVEFIKKAIDHNLNKMKGLLKNL